MRIRILSRYLFKDIVHYFVLFMLVFIVIMLVNEIYDTRSELLEKQPAIADVILFLVLSLPAQLGSFLPLVGLLATMLAYGLLAKNREILAMIAAGISFKRLAVPALAFGVLLSIFAFWFNESVVPVATAHARYLEKVKIGGSSETKFSRRTDLFVKGAGNRFYYIQEYRPGTQTMVHPTVLQLSRDGGGIESRIDARVGSAVKGKDGEHPWEFLDAEEWKFNPNGSLAGYQKFAGPYHMDMGENLGLFLGKNKNPEEMNYGELNDYVTLLRNRGDEETSRFSTPMYQRMAFPFVCLMMAMLGFGAVLDLHARKFARGAFTGIVIAIGYYLLEGVLLSLGQDGHLAPFVAAWGTLLVFTLVVFDLIRRLEQLGH